MDEFILVKGLYFKFASLLFTRRCTILSLSRTKKKSSVQSVRLPGDKGITLTFIHNSEIYSMTSLPGSKAGQADSDVTASLLLAAVGNNAAGPWLTRGSPADTRWVGGSARWQMNLDIATTYEYALFFSLSAVKRLSGNVLQHYVNRSAGDEGEGVGGKWMWVI